MKIKRGYLVFSVVIFILVISLVSAGFYDSFKRVITGNVPQNVSLTIQGSSSPGIVNIPTVSPVTPTQAGIKTVSFNVTVYDQDGSGNLDSNGCSVRFLGPAPDSTVLGPVNCSGFTPFNTYYANYTCSLDMAYFYDSGTWNIVVNVTDKDLRTNGSISSFFYNIIYSLQISPTTISWNDPLAPLSTNASANQHTLVNNTGNYDSQIYINATDLMGVDLTRFPATNFSVAGYSGAECAGAFLGPDGIFKSTGILANRGNLSAAGGQTNIYYCVPLVPQLPSQAYSTQNRGPGFQWFIEFDNS